MAERNIDVDVLKSVEEYIKEISKHFNIQEVYLFGSYAKGTNTQDSDIDVAIVSSEFEDIYDVMAELMGLTWNLDTRIEPHPIRTKDFDEIANPFIHEIIETGIKVV